MSQTTIFKPGQVFTPVALPDRMDRTDEEMRARSRAFFDEIAKRHTVRDYAATPVPRDVIENCIAAAGRAPSGANHQPWHFAVVENPEMKRRIRLAAEEEERAFYNGKAGTEWLDALGPLGTDTEKPFLEIAPYLIVVFAERFGETADGERYKNYYVPESVGIACGFLIAALHHAGLATLTHTPNPMGFLTEICARPEREKPYLILVTGKAASDAEIPQKSMDKKRLDEIASFF